MVPALSLEVSGKEFESVEARIYLPKVKMLLTDRSAVFDTVLDFFTRLQPWEDTWLAIGLKAVLSKHRNLEFYFSASKFVTCLERLQQRQLGWSLSHMCMTEDMWRRLSDFEFKEFQALRMPVSQLFWRETRAKEFNVFCCDQDQDSSEQEVEAALSGLQSRETPLECVCLSLCVHLRTVSDAKPLASAMRGVRQFSVMTVNATMEAWRSFWLSKAMAKNVSLVSFKIELELVITDYSGDVFDELPQPLGVVRDCLQRNLFLESISIGGDLLRTRQWHLGWNGHVEPPLKMNSNHEHRLEPGEARLWSVHARLLQIQSHPKKLFKILRDYRERLFPLSKVERLRDLEHSRTDTIESQNHPWTENIHLWAEGAETKRQLSHRQAELDIHER